MRHLILEYLIRQLLSEEEFTSLNVRSFQGGVHATRTNTFVDAISNYNKEHKPKPITLTKGGETGVVKQVIIIKKSEDKEAGIVQGENKYDTKKKGDMERLKKHLPKLTSGDRLYLVDDKGSKHSITAVAKTKELGGKGKGGTLGPERAAIASLQKQFNEIGGPITVVLNNVEYGGITGVTNVKENQKADFALTRGNDPVIFVSYKPGSSVKDVISYGGLTGASATNEEVAAFIEAVKNNVSDFEGLGYEFGVPLSDTDVALRAIYGSNFGGDYGINNVQALMQGDVKLVEKSSGVYELVSNHTILSPTIPTEDYTPYLNARYAGDRNQFGIKHARFGVVPMGARKNIKNPIKDVQAKSTT